MLAYRAVLCGRCLLILVGVVAFQSRGEEPIDGSTGTEAETESQQDQKWDQTLEWLARLNHVSAGADASGAQHAGAVAANSTPNMDQLHANGHLSLAAGML